MTDFKLVRRDVCAMCQTSQKELEALREVEKAARPLIRTLELIQMSGDEGLEAFSKELKLQAALENLDKARQE